MIRIVSLLSIALLYHVVIHQIVLVEVVHGFSSSSGFLLHPLSTSTTTTNAFTRSTQKAATCNTGMNLSQFSTTRLFVIQKHQDTMTSQDEEVLFDQETTSTTSSHNSIPTTTRKIAQTANNNYKSEDPITSKLISMRSNKLTSCPSIWSELSKIMPDAPALIDDHSNPSNKISLSFSEANDLVQRSAAYFQHVLGVAKDAKVAILGENCAYWILIDHGIQLAGGVSAVRGADAPMDELRYIYEHSDSQGVAVLQGPKLLNKLVKYTKEKQQQLLDESISNKVVGLSNKLSSSKVGLSNSFGDVKHVVFMHREKMSNEEIKTLQKELDITIHVFEDDVLKNNNLAALNPVSISPSEVATIVYTSGTTGNPKGVMVTHANLLHQIKHVRNSDYDLPTYGQPEPLPYEVFVSLLPVWHITERTFELVFLTRGCCVVYSSVRAFKPDLAKHKPQWLVLVPRVLEKVASGVQNKFASGSAVAQKLVKVFTAVANSKSKYDKINNGLVLNENDATSTSTVSKLSSKLILAALTPLNNIGDKLVWSKVKDGFGGRVKYILSGGSALSGVLESFYESAGIPILVGYGLTECSPLISNRKSDSNFVLAGCVGRPLMQTEIRVVDPDEKVASDVERRALPDGQAGLVLVRGPQVMKGYYKNPSETSKSIDTFGFFDTGDLGRFNPQTGDLILTGRAKDTIVLSNGENIEPSPIEDVILTECTLVDQVMLTGQDGRSLIAICVLSPTELFNAGYISTKQEADTLQKETDTVSDPKCTIEALKTSADILKDASDLIRTTNEKLQDDLLQNIRTSISNNPKFQKWEQVQKIYVTLEPFGMVNGLLTQSYKVKRDKVLSRYEEFLS